MRVESEMVDITVEAMQEQIERAAEKLRDYQLQISELESLVSRTSQEQDLWKSLVALHTRTLGPIARPALKKEGPVPFDVEEYGAKSRVMKQHIMSSFQDGVTPKSVQEYMQRQELAVSINFVYKTLNKLKADGEIDSTGGVWRPVKQANEAA